VLFLQALTLEAGAWTVLQGVALVRPLDDGVLHVDDEQRGVRPVRERRHDLQP